MRHKKYLWIVSSIGLIISILLFIFALSAPAKLTTFPESLLKTLKPDTHTVSSFQPYVSNLGKFSFLSKKPVFSELIYPETETKAMNLLKAGGLSFYQQLYRWQERRKALLLFPIADLRGKPTRILMLLFSILFETGNISPELKNHLEKELLNAPKGLWGGFERTSLSLLFLSKRLSLEELSILTRLAKNGESLTTYAAFFQKMPDQSSKMIKISRFLTTETLPDFFKYVARWQTEGINTLLQTLEFSPEAFYLLLKYQKGIGTDWPSFVSQAHFPIPWFNDFHKEHPNSALILKSLLLFTAVFIFLFSIVVMKTRLQFSYYLLFATVSIFFTMVFILGFERGPLNQPELPTLKFSNVISDNLFHPVPSSQGVPDMNYISLAFTVFFLSLQSFLFFLGKNHIQKIHKEKTDAATKLKLLDNEDHLFDMGLYVGLSGTILSLIILTMGWSNMGLMTAYTSTLFGIIEVALLKLTFLRPYKKFLILEISTKGEEEK